MRGKDRRKSRRGGRSRSPDGSGPPAELPLPRTTREISAVQLNGCRNVGLLFDRYIRFLPGWQLGTYKGNRRSHSAVMFNFEELGSAQERCKRDSTWRKMHEWFVARWKTGVKALGGQPFPMAPEWRFVVGLGDKGALEAGLTFHRVYGFPIIPGSALKGLARAAALFEIAEALGIPALPPHEAKERSEKKPPTPTLLQRLETLLLADDERLPIVERRKQKLSQDEAAKLDELRKDRSVPHDAPIRSTGAGGCQERIRHFRAVFGTLHAAGQALFFDAIPAESPVLKPDVMNVHYQDYYSGNTDSADQPIPPADYLNPNPIPFLTVGEGSPFLFAVGWRGEKDEEAHQQAQQWLKEGLQELGVGAKTAAGYGYWIAEGV
jgi:CRISPR-associated protein Cmr6